MNKAATSTQLLFLNLIRLYVRKETFQGTLEQNEGDELYHLAAQHRVTGLIEHVLSTGQNMLDLSVYQQDVLYEFMVNTKQKALLLELSTMLSNQGITYFPIKGFLIKDLYIHPYHRWMSDIDLLINEKDQNAVCQVLLKNGCSIAYYDTVTQDIYQSQEGIGIEVHRMLFHPEFPKISRYFEDNSLFFKGNEKEQLWHHILYIVVHHLKHIFLGSGAGIHLYIDLHLINVTYQPITHDKFFQEALEHLNLLEFFRIFEKIEAHLFLNEEPITSLEENELEIVESDLFGSEEKFYINRVNQRSGNILQYMKSRIFPNRKDLSTIYSKHGEKRFMYPFLILYRIFIKMPQKAKFLSIEMTALLEKKRKKNH